MLDLNFVRDNLALVEEKLRQRGMNPTEVLKDFRAIDGERRQAITAAETLQARRNRASEQIAKLKKSGQDSAAQIQETKVLREQIQESEKKAAEQEARRPPPGALRRISISSPSRTGNWAKRWASSTWSAPPNCPALASPCTGHWARDWSGLSPTTCSICTRESMDTLRCFRRIS